MPSITARTILLGSTFFVVLLARCSAVEEAPPSPTALRTAPAIKQVPVDFNHPPRTYVEHSAQGWRVFIEKELEDRDPELMLNVLSRLDKKLGEMAAALPGTALPDLRKVNLFVMYGPKASGGGRKSGLEFFRASSPKFNGWLDPRMASSIVVFDAANYVALSDLWALKSILHEFGHAQHLEHWPEKRFDMYDAWDHAMKSGLYQTVRDEDKGKPIVNYAAQNHLEYFAELTTMYFARANYFPYDRAGLKAYDPQGYALIEKLWKVNETNSKVP
jgi:hypothetical protein